jgi:hypothetical protein
MCDVVGVQRASVRPLFGGLGGVLLALGVWVVDSRVLALEAFQRRRCSTLLPHWTNLHDAHTVLAVLFQGMAGGCWQGCCFVGY